jgi:hypothetical protein
MIAGDWVFVCEEDCDLEFLWELVILTDIDISDYYKYRVEHPRYGTSWVMDVIPATELMKAIS